MNKAVTWARKPFWPLTQTKVAGLLTVLYLGFIAYFRGSDAWCLLREGELNVLGDFLAGVLTPVALFWLIFGYFLQNKELGLQREELKEARKALGSQAKIMEERAERERLRIMPDLALKELGSSGKRTEFPLLNSGGPARKLVFHIWDAREEREMRWERNQLATTEALDFSIDDVPSTRTDLRYYSCTAVFASELHERFVQGWLITFTGREDPPIEIRRMGEPTRG